MGRDELISAVWGRADVNDALLAQTSLRARRAVGDTGSRQSTIRTVPRFGYRWIALVDALAHGELPPPTSATAALVAEAPITPVVAHPAAQSKHGWRRRSAWIVAVAVALLVVAAGIAALMPRHAATPTPIVDGKPLVVVMPVEVDGGDAESAWVRLGAMDYIATRLRDSGAVAVLPSEQLVTLIGTAHTTDAAVLDRIDRATGAHWIVQPSAHHTDAGWSMRLRTGCADDAHSIEASGVTPLEAAATASVHLLALWGHTAPPAGAPTALTERVQRLDAAMLGGDLAGARQLIDGASPSERSDPNLRVREGQLDFRAGDIDTAKTIFSALGGNVAPLPAALRAQALMGLGAVAVRRNDFPPAEKRYAEALAVLGDGGDPNLVGLAYTGRGVARGAQGNVELALSDFGRARVALERAGNPLDPASVDTDLGLVEGSRRHYAQALAPFDRAIATFERLDVRDNLAASLLGKARAQLALLDLAGAMTSSKRAWDLARELENPMLVRGIDLVRARALLETGKLHDAGTILAGVHATGQPGDDELPELRARLALARGDASAALAALAAPPGGSVQPSVMTLPIYVIAALRNGDRAAAQRVVKKAQQPVPDIEDAFAIELARGEFAAATGDFAGAESHLRDATAHANEGGVPVDKVRAGCAYARVLIAMKKTDQASTVVGELAPYADQDFRVAQITVALFRAIGDQALAASAEARMQALAGERSPDIPAL